MDLTQEQLDAIISNVLTRAETKLKVFATKIIEDLDIPDVRNMATKKFVTDGIETLRVAVTTELSKTNESVNKIAAETDVKIKELTTKKASWLDNFKTVIDYESESS